MDIWYQDELQLLISEKTMKCIKSAGITYPCVKI